VSGVRPTIRTTVNLISRMLPGSLAERHDAHQHRAARARHPDSIALDTAVKLAAASVLLEECIEDVEERHAALVEHATR
jgi:hypothetical protein